VGIRVGGRVQGSNLAAPRRLRRGVERDLEEQVVFDLMLGEEVDLLVVVGDDLDTSQRAVGMAEKRIFAAVGIHPYHADRVDEEALTKLRRLAALEGVVAIGEIGLDKKIETPAMELQTEFFEAQLEIAKELNLPVAIHCRGAFNELLSSLTRVGIPAVGGMIHAFSGNVQLARTFVEFGLKFSLGRSLTYKKCRKREELMAFIYPDHFLLETDSPDMVPIGADPEMPNEPKNIVFNLRGAADILGRDEAEIAETTTQNALHLFALDG